MTNYFGKLGTDQTTVLKDLIPMINKIVEAQNHAKADLFISLFEDTQQKQLKPDDYLTSQAHIESELGKITKTSFLCSTQKKEMPWLLYKVNFDNSPDDHILTVIINDNDPDHRAMGIWIS